MNNIKVKFEKYNEWDNVRYYYTITNDIHNRKIIYINGTTYKDFFGKEYMEWYYILYSDNYVGYLDKILEWNDIIYGVNKYIFEKNILLLEDIKPIICSPEECFEIANYLIKGQDNKGSIYLDLEKVSLDTPCGNYYSS